MDTEAQELRDAKETPRERLLLRMYDQMLNDIDRHIIVVWQSIGVLIGAVATLGLAEKRVVTLDVASALIVLISGWSLAHLIDASYWYNRNLVIIANIERQFLRTTDLRDIHYYFGAHRPSRMITHLKIQFALGIGVAVSVLAYHLIDRVAPGIGSPFSNFEAKRVLPYLALAVVMVYLARLRAKADRKYAEFLVNSPGIPVDTAGISYGEGHGRSRGRPT